MEQFRVFRAIGLSFKAYFANFIPITLLAGIVYAPIFIWVATLPSPGESSRGLESYLESMQHGLWIQQGISCLLAPMITYRVIQYMNGSSSSMMTSVKYGVRGVIPAVILAGTTSLLNLAPFGAIIGTVVTCYWFVCAPAAVVEKLNPVAALGRSAKLTEGRRWGIFGLCFLLGLIVFGVMLIWMVPAVTAHNADPLKRMVVALVVIVAVSQMFMGVVQAVSYTLLRGDKDGVSNEELAKVFE